MFFFPLTNLEKNINEKFFILGKNYYNKYDWQNAFDNFTKIEGEYSDVYYAIASCLIQLNQYDTSLKFINSAIEISDNYHYKFHLQTSFLYFENAKLLFAENRLKEAKIALKKAIHMDHLNNGAAKFLEDLENDREIFFKNYFYNRWDEKIEKDIYIIEQMIDILQISHDNYHKYSAYHHILRGYIYYLLNSFSLSKNEYIKAENLDKNILLLKELKNLYNENK